MGALVLAVLTSLFVPPATADTDLERIEARLIQLENELAASARTVTLAVSPPDAVVSVNGAEMHNGQSIPYAQNEPLTLNAGGDTLKPVAATLVPDEQHTQLVVDLCSATIEEEALYQPPDRVTTTPAGTAELRFDEVCPQVVDKGRSFADQTCAARFEGGSRNPAKYFTLRQEYHSGLPSTCLVLADCVVKTTVTPEKVLRKREVDNAKCTSTAVLQ